MWELDIETTRETPPAAEYITVRQDEHFVFSEAGAVRRLAVAGASWIRGLVVPGGGIEPPQGFWPLRILSPLRLPISPSRRRRIIYLDSEL